MKFLAIVWRYPIDNAPWDFLKDGQVEVFLRPLLSERKKSAGLIAHQEATVSK